MEHQFFRISFLCTLQVQPLIIFPSNKRRSRDHNALNAATSQPKAHATVVPVQQLDSSLQLDCCLNKVQRVANLMLDSLTGD